MSKWKLVLEDEEEGVGEYWERRLSDEVWCVLSTLNSSVWHFFAESNAGDKLLFSSLGVYSTPPLAEADKVLKEWLEGLLADV